MNTHDDFEELLRLLNVAGVELVIVGGYAVAFHGYVRVTKDLDILFRNTPENIIRIRQALNGFGSQRPVSTMLRSPKTARSSEWERPPL